MKVNKKHCDKCGELRVIWKNDGGKRFCKYCWSAHKTTGKIKPTIKQKRIPPRSPKRIIQDAEYSKKRIIFLTDNPLCQAHLPGICTNLSTDVHHKKGRVGTLFLDETHWLSVCRACHSYIETHPKESRLIGHSESKT